MGLFGDIDVSEVPEDPYWVDDGTYLCLLAEVKKVDNEEKETHGISFNWTITEEDSEFEGSNIQDWKNTYPGITQDDLDDMEPDQRKRVKSDLARLKNRLAQMGFSEDEMNSDDFMDYANERVGDLEAYVTVKNSTDSKDPSKKYRNVTWVRLPEPE